MLNHNGEITCSKPFFQYTPPISMDQTLLKVSKELRLHAATYHCMTNGPTEIIAWWNLEFHWGNPFGIQVRTNTQIRSIWRGTTLTCKHTTRGSLFSLTPHTENYSPLFPTLHLPRSLTFSGSCSALCSPWHCTHSIPIYLFPPPQINKHHHHNHH